MKPYYQDKFVTIYNDSTNIYESDVVVLDPPRPLTNANVFKAKVYFIFCGKNYDLYRQQFPDKSSGRIYWDVAIPDGAEKVIYRELVLILGSNYVPGGIGQYNLKTLPERYNKWQRPVEFLQNLLGCTEGDILDPYMGSGATLVAAKSMGRKATGFEIEEELCKITAQRCRELG